MHVVDKPNHAGARVISVGGGKGGVGKSLVATNLAVAIAQTGRDVVLCDLDLGAANLHLMMGALHPKAGIAALLSPDATLEDTLTPTKIPRLQLLAGAGGTVGAANITHGQKLRIIRKLKSLKTDVVVVDVGAGVGYNALDFFELGQQRIIVATPQVTSMHDAYAFLKGAVLRTLKHHAGAKTEAWMLDPAMASKDGEKVKDLLLRVREQDPNFGAKIERILKHFGAFLVGNQVETPGQVGVFQAVARMVEDFLGISLPILGWIPSHSRLSESVNERTPFMARTERADSREARAFRAVVEALLAGDMAPEEELLVELVEEDAKPDASLPALDPASLEVAPILAHAQARLAPPPPPPAAALAPVAAPAQAPAVLQATSQPAAVAPVVAQAPPGPMHERTSASDPASPTPSAPPGASTPSASVPRSPPPPPAPGASVAAPSRPAATSTGPVTMPGGSTPADIHMALPAARDTVYLDADEPPSEVMPRIYVRPMRKRKVDPEEKKRRRALELEGRRRKLTLPGMPPTRAKDSP